ncbi:hypothetical protein SUGI_0801540 [Cryptomeria japonica]|nr:hypothetical protein SUGI_0801540 [Cryptomeria japonica]
MYRVFWALLALTCFSSSFSASFHGRKILDYPEITNFSSSGNFHGRKILDYPESLQPSLAPNRPSIDPNLVLILAALLCALFFGLGLNLMVRCALCLTSVLRVPAMAGRGHMTSTDHATSAVSTGRANTGLKKAVIDALPLVAYGGAAISGGVDNGGGADIECVICLREFVEGERVRVLPNCAHCFHVECIDRWFVSHSLCPICRTRMPESLEKKTAAANVPANVPCSNCGRTNGDESTAPDGSQNVGTQSAPSDLASCSGTGSNVVAEGAVS